MLYYISVALVAQLDRASPSGGEGQGFESSRARHVSMMFFSLILKSTRGLTSGPRLFN